MFNFSATKLQDLLCSQANLFNSLHGAGDSLYEGKDLTTGIYRERRSGLDRSVTKTFVSQTSATNTSKKEVLLDYQALPNHRQHRVTVEEVFQRYKLTNITGPQWTQWRAPKVVTNQEIQLPPTPQEPFGEIMMDLHEEKMECLCYTFDEAPMSLTY